MMYCEMSTAVLRDEDHLAVDVAPYPWTMKDGESWSDAALEGQIERLERALPLEEDAISEIGAAVASGG